MIINEVRLNQHQSHLESLVMFGKKGLEEINYKVENFINRFKDNNDNLNITTKIDGSPSLFIWSHVDGYPDNSIALKGFVNGPQTAMSSEEEIDKKYGDRPDMADKLKQGLKLAKYIPSGEAWQGDCLFTQSTLEEREINGKNYLTFQPNKIIYAFSEDNPGYNRVKSADFGIAFHTIYRVNNGKLSQSFRVNTERLNAPNNFYLLSPAINQNLNKDSFDLSHIESLYNKLREVENKLINDKAYEELINNKQFINYWNMFENKMLADNKATNINVNTLIDDLTSYIEEKSNKELDRKLNVLKTDDAKERARNAQASNLEQLNSLINNNKDTLKNIVDALNITSDIKMLMLKGFKQVKQDYSTFYKSKTKGYFTADPEGIAMSDDDGNIVKLVDRSAFSSYNRNPDIESGWAHEDLKENDQSKNISSKDIENLFKELNNIHYGAGGNCGNLALAVARELSDIKDVKIVICSNGSHDEPKNLRDYADNELDIWHVALLVDGKIYDFTGETSVKKLEQLCINEYDDHDPVIFSWDYSKKEDNDFRYIFDWETDFDVYPEFYQKYIKKILKKKNENFGIVATQGADMGSFKLFTKNLDEDRLDNPDDDSDSLLKLLNYIDIN